MATVMVVVRQLNENTAPIASAVIAEPTTYVDDVDHYFKSKANEHIDELKSKFCEFKEAKFYTYIIDTI